MSIETEELPVTGPARQRARRAWWAPRLARRAVAAAGHHPYLVSTAIYALVALVAVWPVWPGDPSRLPTCLCGGNKDPNQTVWFLSWTPYALLHGQNLLTTSFLNQPFGIGLAQNTSMPLLGLLAAPLTLAVSPVASENLLRFLAFPLSAGAMCFVLRRFVAWSPAAFAGGLLYGFSPYMVGQGSVHLDLSFVPLPPLILYVLYELLVRQERSALRWGLLLGVLCTAQFFVSAEILATTGLTAAIAVFFLFFLCIRSVPRRAPHALLGLAVAACLVAPAVAYPVYLMTHGPLHYVGPSQGLNEVYNADLLGPILPTLAELVAPHRLAVAGTRLVAGPANIDENGSYLGLPLLVLSAYLALRYWRRLWPLFLVLMAATMFLFSLGPRLEVDGAYHRLPFRLPFAHLSRLPFLEDLLPVRLALYVVLFLAALVALGMDAYHDDLLARARRRASSPAPGGLSRGEALRGALREVPTWSGRLLGGALVLATLVALLPRWPYRSVDSTPAPAERAPALAAIPTGARVLTYPYVTPFTDQGMLWQALDGMRFKLFGSYALRPGVKGGATPLPSELVPVQVEAMLADPLTPVPLPGLPYLAPTAETVVATEVVVTRSAAEARAVRGAVLTGTVENVDLHTGAFSVFRPGSLDLAGVRLLPHTRFVIPWTLASRLLRVERADHVAVLGRVLPGSITAPRIRDLRLFLRRRHVGAVLVEMGLVDSREVATWVRAAAGPPTEVLPGGELWLDPGRGRG